MPRDRGAPRRAPAQPRRHCLCRELARAWSRHQRERGSAPRPSIPGDGHHRTPRLAAHPCFFRARLKRRLPAAGADSQQSTGPPRSAP